MLALARYRAAAEKLRRVFVSIVVASAIIFAQMTHHHDVLNAATGGDPSRKDISCGFAAITPEKITEILGDFVTL